MQRGKRRRPPGRLGWLEERVGRRGYRTVRLRLLVQGGFAALSVLVGLQLARFVAAAERGDLPLPSRPAGVDGFLPISGLLGLVDWFRNGSLNRVHPAATVILSLALALALLARKGFCSWICPLGFLSDLLARLGRRLFGRTFRPWRWLDVPLRALKYLLLGFFAQAILRMSASAMRAFIESPYNRVADIKMGLFFTEMGPVGWSVMIGLAAGSVLVHGFWCRYLCPYGALLGLVSWLSPVRIRRAPASCIDCGLCDRACPSRLPVSRRLAVRSVECTGCLDCVASCPVEAALAVQAGPRRLRPVAYAALVLTLFVGGWAAARALGAWGNDIGDREYVLRIRDLRHGGGYVHPGLDGAPPSR